ncbi:tetratricopeptide repeat-containing sulfotransferase family protein [Luteimonas lutimaris]|uniref:Tetratricopeptide repeat-containing sulfotransferase family protein n=1 Tax=Luteimonas lutimaris TaxID=698645 RepID=A0ABP7MCU9_9GAMM
MNLASTPPATSAGPVLHRKIARGSELLRKGQIAEAVELAQSIAAAYPDQPQALAFAAEACRLKGDLPAALAWIDKAIAAGGDPQHKIKRAWLLSRMYRRDEIPAFAAQIEKDAGNDALVLWQLGKLHYHHNRLRDAIGLYERALAIRGDHPGWRYDLAIARFYSGDFDGAGRELDKVLSATPESGAVLYLRSTLRKQRADNNNVADLEARLEAGFRNPDDKAAALYALAKELEDLGEYGKAFSTLEAGARTKRGTLRYDADQFFETLREIRSMQDADALAAPAGGHEEEGAIFIVGMPRTGTTLTQRLLLQSGKVKDAGELTDFGYLLTLAVREQQEADPSLSPVAATLRLDFAGLGRQYMRAARQMADGSPMFIDKMPVNYMYCGVIHKALPNARIIHLVRDPLDSCYAIFKTLFFNAYDFSYDLDELGEYYIAYHRTMQHWREVMPGAILDVRYEDLVTDTEAQARRIYDWCGLEWTPRALEVPDSRMAFATASAVQVREPVHARSVNSSRRHADALAPLAEKLAAAGVLES